MPIWSWEYPRGLCMISCFNDMPQFAASIEVDEYWVAILIDHDLGRRDIIKDVTQPMDVFKPVADTFYNPRDAFWIKHTATFLCGKDLKVSYTVASRRNAPKKDRACLSCVLFGQFSSNGVPCVPPDLWFLDVYLTRAMQVVRGFRGAPHDQGWASVVFFPRRTPAIHSRLPAGTPDPTSFGESWTGGPAGDQNSA
ncbi:hypothetical protein BS17DRAFT_769518 [Gyrodon lividus]|nr:hypothetical protein BS17DRAFT_769518 [Gyrodon lividus]